mgnify:CR=1 FL=1
MIKSIKYLSFILIISQLGGQESKTGIPYGDLKTGDDVRQTGRMLQEKSMGLHGVEYGKAKWDTVFIAVHGYGSRGYEWVYGLRKMAEAGFQTFYYRWDWEQCPGSASRNLQSAIDSLLSVEKKITHINMFGHSYGGVIVTALADDEFNVTMDIHSLAAPLAGHTRLEKNCTDYPRFDNLTLTNKLFQWRTVHKQDGAFKDLAVDPQLIDIDGSEVVQLHATFPNGRPLGHNWSITWVMDQYFGVAN